MWVSSEQQLAESHKINCPTKRPRKRAFPMKVQHEGGATSFFSSGVSSTNDGFSVLMPSFRSTFDIQELAEENHS